MRVHRLLIVALLFVSASGCHLPPIGDITADPSCHTDDHVGETDIFVVTTRGFRCISMVAEFGPYREMSRVNFGRSAVGGQFPNGLSPTFLVEKSAWQSDLDKRVKTGGPPVIYIHGYNNSEDEAVRRARAIGSLLMDSRPVIAVTWPSYAMKTAVGWDEANNEWAREALSAELEQLVTRYSGTTLVAHSMGNRILLDFLIRHPDALRNIGQIIAAAPDVDEDQFMRHMQKSSGFAMPVTIYTSTRDQALATSWMLHGMRRAGDLSATAHNHKLLIRYADLQPNLVVVDLSQAEGDPIGHSDFIRSVAGAADLCRVLNHVSGVQRPKLQEQQYFQLAREDSISDECNYRARQATKIDEGK